MIYTSGVSGGSRIVQGTRGSIFGKIVKESIGADS